MSEISNRNRYYIIAITLMVLMAALYWWMNRGISSEELGQAVESTILTIRLNDVTIGENYTELPSMMEGKKIYINFTLYNPSAYQLEIEIRQLEIQWISKYGGIRSLGGKYGDQYINIDSGDNTTFKVEAFSSNDDFMTYETREIETPEYMLTLYFTATAEEANGKKVMYTASQNRDGGIDINEETYGP